MSGKRRRMDFIVRRSCMDMLLNFLFASSGSRAVLNAKAVVSAVSQQTSGLLSASVRRRKKDVSVTERHLLAPKGDVTSF